MYGSEAAPNWRRPRRCLPSPPLLALLLCVGARFVVSPSVAERKGDKDKAVAAAVQLASFWVVTRFSGAASISGLILQLIH